MSRLRITPWPGLKVLIPGDIHCPFQDMDAIGAMVEIFESQFPEQDFENAGVVIQGDMHEASALSSHQKSRKRQVIDIGDEIDEARKVFDMLHVEGMAFNIFIPGNHEQRAERFTADQPGIISEDVRTFWCIPEEWSCMGWRGVLNIGPLTVCHGDTLKGALSQGGASTVLRRYPTRSTIYGHTHRVQCAYHTVYTKDGQPETHGAWSVGHMCKPEELSDMGYAVDENWQKGFAIVHFYENQRFNVVQYVAFGRSFFDPVIGEVTF